MALPSRVYVGMVVLAFIVTLLIVPYTLLLLAGYEPPPEAPYEALFPQEQEERGPFKFALALASVACLFVTVTAWRTLVRAARRDMARRRAPPAPIEPAREDEPIRVPPPPRKDDEPPGYQ